MDHKEDLVDSKQVVSDLSVDKIKKDSILPEIAKVEDTNINIVDTIPNIEIKKVSKPKKIIKRPKIHFDNTIFNFGEINEGDIVKHNFIFKNTGNGDLDVEKTDVSCGCTVPSYPFLSISPSDSSYIGAVFNSVGKDGMQEAKITVYSNGSTQPISLILKGNVTPKAVQDSI